MEADVSRGVGERTCMRLPLKSTPLPHSHSQLHSLSLSLSLVLWALYPTCSVHCLLLLFLVMCVIVYAPRAWVPNTVAHFVRCPCVLLVHQVLLTLVQSSQEVQLLRVVSANLFP